MNASPTHSTPKTGHRRSLLAWAAGALAVSLALAACQTPAPAANDRAELTLHEGDVVKIAFPGAADLNPPEPLLIRRDGKITLPIVGEVAAAGLTPAELQNELLGLFSKQLVTKEVLVTVVSSSFVVFVDGNVVRPGKVVSDHPITALEAVMEAGGFDYHNANPSKVMVIRHQAGTRNYSYYTVNLKLVLDGRESDAFYLAPGDVVHVPEAFTWF
jgi:polysaccharide export outer membrane protein